MTLRLTLSRALLIGAAVLPFTASPAASQNTVSQPVVQALPAPEVQRLNRALVALAKAPRDRDALIEAGQAALSVDDLEAAIGFFGRAAEVDPGSPAVAQGLGAVYLRAGRAGEALLQFERALAGGAPERELLTDQALTLDLVGDQAAAQAAYTRALSLDPANDEARRRLGISHAISGNRAAFEEVLRPLLDRRDLAANRARAFGLAILGDSDRATTLIEQMMPRDMATRLVPYLGYMPRLTKPQQAAAANLGIFPRAADIGRDDPRLARFAADERAESRLVPAGPPLDARPAPAPAPAPMPTPTPTAVAAAPAPAPQVATAAPATVTTVAAAVPAPAPAYTQPQPQPAYVPPAPAPAPAPVAAPPVRVADAFADFIVAPLPTTQVSGNVVDLSRITVKRELPAPKAAPAPEKPKAKEPPKPVHPSRVWVQVATGRNAKALGFDWKRISKEGGAPLAKLKPFTTPWGEAHRLLAGPVDSRDKAQALVRELKAKGVDSFMYLSPEGEEIQPVQ